MFVTVTAVYSKAACIITKRSKQILEAWCQNRVLSEFMLLSRFETRRLTLQHELNEVIWI
jgi:hypothetical protein